MPIWNGVLTLKFDRFDKFSKTNSKFVLLDLGKDANFSRPYKQMAYQYWIKFGYVISVTYRFY